MSSNIKERTIRIASTISEKSQASEESFQMEYCSEEEFFLKQSRVSKAAHNCTLSQNTDLHG